MIVTERISTAKSCEDIKGSASKGPRLPEGSAMADPHSSKPAGEHERESENGRANVALGEGERDEHLFFKPQDVAHDSKP